MSPASDPVEPLVDDDAQFLLFEPVKVSTFNPPAEPRRSAADWLLNSTKSIEDSSSVKEGLA